MTEKGTSLIGFEATASDGPIFTAIDPVRNESIEPKFRSATAGDIDKAVRQAAAAAPAWAKLPGAERNRFLGAVAAKLEAAAAELVARAMRETALPEARLKGELARTCGQLRLYGATAQQGDWIDARIETAQPDRKPLAKPDHRSMVRPLGPVVVFGSSNFPFAYSVAGGDTASAFAAGCPVIVKAHPAHPGTGELVGRLIVEAVRDCGLPPGSFSLLFDGGFEVGQALVKHPLVKAVGFTGSLRGGRALADLAAARPEPIPVYAEMGSVNPLFILPGALEERAAAIVEGLHASATVGVGQFCTNPGIIVLERSPAAEDFVKKLAARLSTTPEASMLTPGICENFRKGVAARAKIAGIRSLGASRPATEPEARSRPSLLPQNAVAPTWFETDAPTFLGNQALSDEIFGPSSVIVWCPDRRAMLEVARHMEGSLTATLHAGGSEAKGQGELVDLLAQKAGRVILNGYPTGLEVSPAIVHGGPYPATSDGGRSTSVGTRALMRWTRLVCYQGFDGDLLPPELRDANPLGLRRLVNGESSTAPI